MQKQKNKSKVKSRELNRKGAEKEGTDMDAFVNPVHASIDKIDTMPEPISPNDVTNNENIELSKDIKEKDNYENKKESEASENIHKSLNENSSNSDDVNKKSSSSDKETLPKSKNNNDVSLTQDVVDHIVDYRSKIEQELTPLIVAQKNEENSKVSELCVLPKEDKISHDTINPSTVVSITATNADALDVNTPISTLKPLQILKYTYLDDQWSPINTKGKKVYGREFLMELQYDPNSKMKPLNLPDLDVVLKDNTKIRSPADHRFKDVNLGRHDSLLPGFVKSSLSAKAPPANKKSHSGKPKANKPNVIHVSLSLREDIILQKTENAWKPTRLAQGNISEEQAKTDALYKKVRSVLNKLTPQKFHTLVNQVRELQIDTQERLQGVIDLVFEKREKYAFKARLEDA